MLKKRENKELFSVTRLVTNLFTVLMVVLLVLAFSFSLMVIRSTYVNTGEMLQKSTENAASELNESVSALENQTEWLAGISRDSAVWNSSSPYEDMLWKNKMTDSLQNFLIANSGIDAVIVSQRNNTTLLQSHTTSEEVFLRLIDSCSGMRSITPKSMGLFSENGEGISHLIFKTDIREYHNKYGTANRLIANIYTLVQVDSLLPGIQDNELLLLTLSDDNGYHVIASRGIPKGDSVLWEKAVNGFAEGESLVIGKTRYMSHRVALSNPGWSVFCFQPFSVFVRQMIPTVLTVALLFIAVIVLIVLGERVILRQIRAPLTDMITDIERIREKGYTHRLNRGGTLEFSQVTDSFNTLLDDLSQQTDVIVDQQKKLYEVQLLQKESQMLSLQSQIKPHFLYNTLECVTGIARYHNIPEIVRIVNGMIRIYRYSTVAMQNGTVGSELDCASRYADIMDIRSEGKYKVIFDADGALADCRMPKMVLQPLIENAINHGLFKRTAGGTVTVSCAGVGENVVIAVRDDGIGMTPERLTEVREILSGRGTGSTGSGIALYNIHTRLRTEYGEPYGLTLESKEGEYTVVTVTFPREEAAK